MERWATPTPIPPHTALPSRAQGRAGRARRSRGAGTGKTNLGRKPQARPARMAASGGRTGAGQALPCVSNPANPASTLHTLERAWTRWGQLFQGVTGFGTPPPIQCAPVTCASRLSARTPRSQGAASRPAFRASALPPRSGRPGCPCGGRSWQRVCGRWQRPGKTCCGRPENRFPSGLTGGPI